MNEDPYEENANAAKEEYLRERDREEAELALSILRKIVSDPDSYVATEQLGPGWSGLIDTSWFSLSEEESRFLLRLTGRLTP